MPTTFRRLNRKVKDESGEEKFELLATVGVDNIELDVMKGATSEIDGVIGLVPAPEKGNSNRYLRSDGTWAEPASDLPSAGSGGSGLMTPEQVSQLQQCVTNISNLTNSLSSTNTKVTNLSNTVNSLSSKHTSDINSLNGSIGNINKTVNSINERVNLHNQQFSEIIQMINTINERINRYHGLT